MCSQATPDRLADIEALLRSVDLPVEGVRDHLPTFLVAEENGRLIGVAGLEVYGDAALLRSLAVAPDHQGRGFGQRLYRAVLDWARELGIRDLYLLTETAEAFFARQGFIKIPRQQADPRLSASVEFQTCCPASAVCMHLSISTMQ